MDAFLPSIENPKGLPMKLAYYFTRRQFGKVLTPLKVHSARLPAAFGLFYARIGRLDKKLQLPAETVLLIRQQVARINVCLFCIDISQSFTIKGFKPNLMRWAITARARFLPMRSARPWTM